MMMTMITAIVMNYQCDIQARNVFDSNVVPIVSIMMAMTMTMKTVKHFYHYN